MKRPFTLLCLSDLHLVSEIEKQKIDIDKLLKSLKKNVEKSGWNPDFLVVAGDFVVAKNKEGGYESAKNVVNKLLEELNLNNRFIAVPGNHDKSFEEPINKSDERNKIEVYIKDRTYEGGNFSSHFEEYKEFYTNYLGENEKNRYNPMSFLMPFKEAGVCFLEINTEIGYIPHDKHKPDYQRLPLDIGAVYNSLNEYRTKYPDCVLVTVMHRDPRELCWEDRIGKRDPHIPDVLSKIYSMSCVILTGHDHVEKILPPDLMANRSQLYKLGSPSVKPKKGEIAIHKAYLLNVDPLHDELSLKVLAEEGDPSQENSWKEEKQSDVIFFHDNYRTNIRNIYKSKFNDSFNFRNAINRVRAKSSNPEDIKSALRTIISSGYELKIVHIKNANKTIDTQSLSKPVFVFLYEYAVFDKDEEYIESFSNAIKLFKKEHQKQISSMKIIVDCVLIEVPRWDEKRENWSWN